MADRAAVAALGVAEIRRRWSGTALAVLVVVAAAWAGMLIGVSFVATPAKFMAPSLSLTVALDVGRHTFGLYNPIEIGCSVALVLLLLISAPGRWGYLAAALACGAVAIQAIWLLPVLDARVEMIMAGGEPPPSRLHDLYIGLEVLKLSTLLSLAAGLLRWKFSPSR